MLRQVIRVSKFWREYAGHLAVEAIDDKVMREFIPWRRDYYAGFDKLPKNAKRHPADKTVQWDLMLGKAIVKWAAEQGLRGKQPAITVTFTPKKKRVRPAFERWEYRLLWRTLCKRIKTARDKRTKASRELLRSYVLVLANSGIRTGEANKLKVTDVHSFKDEKQRHNYRLVVRGKTGERDAIVRSVAANPGPKQGPSLCKLAADKAILTSKKHEPNTGESYHSDTYAEDKQHQDGWTWFGLTGFRCRFDSDAVLLLHHDPNLIFGARSAREGLEARISFQMSV
jgi:hypothetical protein